MIRRSMNAPTVRPPARHLRAADIRGLAQLAAEATVGVTRIVEGVHQSVLGTIGLPGGREPGQTGGVTGLVYRGIHALTGLFGKSVDRVLAALEPLLEREDDARSGTPQREAVLAVLNGVIGDRLAASNNPLAIPMTIRYQGEVLNSSMPPMPQATGRILLLIHGLCMNDQQWDAESVGRKGKAAANHAGILARTLGYTPIHLRYNTGLHISQNGRELANQLEACLARWPVPVEELTVLAHSMGGLVVRSAVRIARQAGLRWPDSLKSIVFLGTPHHGAPLERAGNVIDFVLGSTPYTAPFAKLGHMRSAGITDLRYGFVADEDWHGHDRFHRKPDNRLHVPLPEGVACYAVAATLASRRSPLADRLIGDGLVPLHSALGQHRERRRSLGFAGTAHWVIYGTRHMDLLTSPQVSAHLVKWLTPATRDGGAGWTDGANGQAIGSPSGQDS